MNPIFTAQVRMSLFLFHVVGAEIGVGMQVQLFEMKLVVER